jgi:AraC-like DNA-binding protein
MDASPIRLDFVRPRQRWCGIVARRLARALGAADAPDVLAAAALAAALVEREADGLAASRRAVAMLDAALIAQETPLVGSARAILEETAEALLDAREETTPAVVAHRLCSALHVVARQVAPRPSGPSLETAVPGFVADHLHAGARLGDLARRLGYSTSHCSTLVRRATGERFSALRRRMQLERAIGLLCSGTSVKEAALGAGFSDPAYFSRVFARRFGVPPSRWREVVGCDPGA